MLGVTVAIAPVYVYSTGMTTVLLAIVTGVLVGIYHGREGLRLLLIGIAAGLATVLLAFVFRFGDLYFNAFRDITWWVFRAGDIWSLPIWSFKVLRRTMILVVVMAGLGVVMLRQRNSGGAWRERTGPIFLLLAAAILIGARDMLDRADSPHAGLAMLPVAIAVGALLAPALYRLAERSRPGVIIVGLLMLLLASGGDPRRIYWTFKNSATPEFSALSTPDSEILPQDVKVFLDYFSDELATSKCLLNLSNEGVLNYASRLPPCGDFLYPVYASTEEGDGMIVEFLDENPQSIVVVSTDDWPS